MILMFHQWRHYKKCYFQLITTNFVRYDDQLWDKNDIIGGITVFLECGSFKFANEIYLHRQYYVYLDPVSCYWLWKCTKFIKTQNVTNMPGLF